MRQRYKAREFASVSVGSMTFEVPAGATIEVICRYPEDKEVLVYFEDGNQDVDCKGHSLAARAVRRAYPLTSRQL